MNYQFIKLERYSKNEINIYSIILDDSTVSLYEKFLIENKTKYIVELKEINATLTSIGKYGAREYFFRKRNEGRFGDGVCALFDERNSYLRLYCIRVSDHLLIVGGGGVKSKLIRSWQQDPALKIEAERMINISKDIKNGIVKIK